MHTYVRIHQPPPNMDTSPIYFWRETGPEGYLSQWWASDPSTSSSSPPVTFKTAEHYMMHGKALLFGDADAALVVLQADHPRKARALGRQVRGFDEALWASHRERIVREGNLLKFRCAPELRRKLLATGERELVEASPLDRVWGIGFSPGEAPVGPEPARQGVDGGQGGVEGGAGKGEAAGGREEQDSCGEATSPGAGRRGAG
ncbi:DUF1768-domain-containing protein [Colletotrichum sublineola]|nr:DUF1768-domain-containing protein [Colletotrichum sublineola]